MTSHIEEGRAELNFSECRPDDSGKDEGKDAELARGLGATLENVECEGDD